MGEVQLIGTHGTSSTRAARFCRYGVHVSDKGRRGKGMYFWRDGAMAFQLAEEWYNFRYRQKAYKGDADTRCLIIKAALTTDEDLILDLDDDMIKYEIEVLVQKRLKPSALDDDISALYDLYVSSLEKKLSIVYSVLKASVGPPPCGAYSTKALGYPRIYIARTKDCVQILSVHRCDGAGKWPKLPLARLARL